MANSGSSRSSGITFGGALTLLFIGLRLGHVIDWSWWWVLSPLWIGGALVAAVLLVIGGVAAVASVRRSLSRRKVGR